MLPKALGPVRLITAAKYDIREDQQISQTRCTETHDAPGSFLLSSAYSEHEGIETRGKNSIRLSTIRVVMTNFRV